MKKLLILCLIMHVVVDCHAARIYKIPDTINSEENSAVTVKYLGQNPQFLMPDTIYAASGKEINIYYDNIIYGRYTDYFWDVSFTDTQTENADEQLSECWRYTPTSTGSNTLTITAYRKENGYSVFSATSTVVSTTATLGAIQTNYLNSADSELALPVAETHIPIAGYGDYYDFTNSFNFVQLRDIGGSTSEPYRCEYVDLLIYDVTGDPASGSSISGGTLVLSNRVDVAPSASFSIIDFKLSETIYTNDFSGRCFMSYLGVQSNGVDWALLASNRGGMDNRDPTNESFYCYTSTNTWNKTYWAGVSGDSGINIWSGNIITNASDWNVLCIGDSTGAGSAKWSAQLSALETNLTFLGTQDWSGHSNECVSGKTWAWHYSDADSSFTFGGTFDFDTYCTTNGFTNITHVVAHLGINDIYGKTSDAEVLAQLETDKTYIDAIIGSISNYNSEIKIYLCTVIPPAYEQDAFGDDYDSGKTRWFQKRAQLMYGEGLYNEYKDRTDENIYVIPLHLNMDTENNFPTTTEAVNARNSTNVTRQNNGVHPDTSGYQQMADTIYSFLSNNN